MSPYETIAQKYTDEPEDCPFDHYLRFHLKSGFVHSTPDFFVMAIPVCREELKQGLRIPCDYGPDCWYISAMAGNMAKAWELIPYELPFIAFDRGASDKKELHILPFGRIKQHVE